MRHFVWAALLGAAVVVAPSQQTFAADLPVKAAPRVVVPFSWTGCYVGGNAGIAWGRSELTHTPTGAWVGDADAPILSAGGSSDIDTTGFTAGGQIGCNWQGPTSRWVIGFEVDAAYLDLDEETTNSVNFVAPGSVGNFRQETNIDWLVTARLRAGYAFAERWLAYVTGGFAFGHAEISQSIFFTATGTTASGSDSATKAGWVVGAGLEYAWTNNWILRGEYLYVDLGTVSATLTNPGFPTFTHTISSDNTIHIARLALSYKFR
jgi:outer membrane immunogenic protein